jgi:ABC-type microcin C transport system duplicated ATPase subunit YejF
VGESGCGKTTAVRCILRLYKPTSGNILFKGKDISGLPERKFRPLRREMGTIFQYPFGSFKPRQSAGSIVADPLIIHHLAAGKELDQQVACFKV